ncbi:MAG: double-strand break repair helicase AddA [Alphaproteobacteria bacterium]|nr:double-strand break repair helicase AddA [Alphaproteobacteria bacterium]
MDRHPRRGCVVKQWTDQQIAANPDMSVWVHANAGTGKTRVLTDRVLRLLLDGTAPSRILCITFTKAAAAEMATRLYGELGDWARMDEADLAEALLRLRARVADEADMETARQLFARALDAPGGLRIQTIHGFCESLLARFPVEAGIVPHFTVMDERTAAELLRDAREAVFIEAGEKTDSDLGRALETVTGHISEGTFASVLDALAKERGKLHRAFARHGGPAGLVRAVRERMGLKPGEDEEKILTKASKDRAFDRKALARVVEALAGAGKKDQARAARIAGWLAAPETRVENFDDYLGAFFTEGGTGERFAKLADNTTLKACPDAADILAAEATRLERLRERRHAAIVVEATEALLRLGGALLKAYDGLKSESALLDYDDLVLEARRLLEREGIAPWVLFKLDGGIDHILVDEAQDTNPDQWQVISKLASEFFTGAGAREELRTVFAVGDVKQSIFSFQRADPAAFGAMRAYFADRVQAAAQKWRDVPLERSFRSAPAILKTVDRVFAAAAARDGVVGANEKVTHDPARRGQAGRVELWPAEAPVDGVEVEPWALPLKQARADAPEKRLARKMAIQIRKWLDSGERLPSRNRAIRPGDILVLVRRRNIFFDELVRTFKLPEYNIPVAGTDRMVLTNQLAVRDLIAFGRCVLLPEDDLNLAVVLKSPLIGLDDDALFALAHDRPSSLWEALAARRREREDFEIAFATLSRWLARADYVPPFEFYASLLSPGRGRERLIARLGREVNDPIDEFLNLALAYEKIHAPSLEGFLHWIEAGGTDIKRDLEQGRDEVRVMTVHGAKGLQAPIVFLPDTCQVPDKDRALLWLGEEDDVPLWPPRRAYEESVAREAREAQRRLRDQEYRRLLYVALTRAEDRLYVAGWAPKKAGSWYELIEAGLQGLAAPVSLEAGGEGLRLEDAQTADPDKTGKPLLPVSDARKLPAWARQPAPAESLPSPTLAPSRPEGAEPAMRSPVGKDSGPRFQRGRIVHRLLQFLPDLAPADRSSACRRYLAESRHALTKAAQQAIAKEVLALLEAETFAPLFGPDSRAEVPIIGEVNGRVIAGQVDRLLVTEKTVLVIDYKTGREPPASVEAIPEIYLRQMAAYMSLLSKLFPERKKRAALLWTDGPNLMPLNEEFLHPYAP